MSEQVKNLLGGSSYNPDVLECLANLSNDEVFTPPKVVNSMLDMLPPETWTNPNLTFLDPACKTGVFLREIAKRLIVGLEKEIPNLQERLDHIFHKQLYGIAITELTALTSRRSLYCSKYANGKYSVSKFDDPDGNIRFVPIRHTWESGKCKFCGASAGQYQRDDDLETHAYEFIHTNNPEEIFGMKFDVIIGNPPYQLSDGGHGASAMPIYQKFVDQCIKLAPKDFSFITPSRWFTGGRGLDSFRERMLHDKRIAVINDYLNASECFPGVEIKGGVSYFLWKKDYYGDCRIITHDKGESFESTRPLLENGLDVFIRDSRRVGILHKVMSKREPLFYDKMSANDPFGYDVRVENSYKRIKPDIKHEPFENAYKIYYFGWRKDGVGYIDKSTVRKGKKYVDKYKVLIPRAYGSGEPASDKLNAFIVGPGSVCTETYSVIGPFDTKEDAQKTVNYINTKFFHFLVSMAKITQAAAKHVYKFVPEQADDLGDAELYKKYGFSDEEINYIENTIWPKQEDN